MCGRSPDLIGKRSHSKQRTVLKVKIVLISGSAVVVNKVLCLSFKLVSKVEHTSLVYVNASSQLCANQKASFEELKDENMN